MFLLALLFLPAGVSVNVYPLSGTAPLALRVRVTVQPDPANRAVCVFYLSEDAEEAESCWSLNGAQAPRTTTRFYTLPRGIYEVGAVLQRATPPERVMASRERIVVIGPEP